MTENSKSKNRFPAWAHWLMFGLCLLPPVALAILLRCNAVNVPYWDEWDDDLAGIFLKWHAGSLSLGDFWTQHNESRLVLPRVIFLLLGGFSRWNLLHEVAFTFLLACAAAAMIFRLGQKTLAEHPTTGWLAFFIASLLIFSPTQYQAWLWGMELILYLPLVCILASLLVLQTNFSGRTKLFLCAALATASTYSFSNGLLAWIALFPILFLSEGWSGLQKNSRAALLWLFAFFGNVALYFQDYEFPPSPGFWRVLCLDPLRVVEYLLAFLGNPLVNQNSDNEVAAGIIIGGGQLILFIAVCILIFRWRRNFALMNRVWPWLTLGGYGILSALLATTGRAAFGAEQALSPRYGIFGVCLTAALIFLVPIILFRWAALENAPRFANKIIRGALVALGITVVTLHALAFPPEVMNLTVFGLDLRLAKSSLKFLDVLPPQPATLAFLCPNYPKVKNMADALDRAGVWNYSLLQTRRLADFKISLPPANAIGSIETSQVIGTNLFLSGWALAPTRHAAADCVVFTCEATNTAPQIFALMDQRSVRMDLVNKFHEQIFLVAGWQKNCPLAELPKGALTVKAWSYDVETDALSPLANEVHLDNR
jgi:hypothetical protein